MLLKTLQYFQRFLHTRCVVVPVEGMYPYSDVEAAQQAEVVKVLRNGEG